MGHKKGAVQKATQFIFMAQRVSTAQRGLSAISNDQELVDTHYPRIGYLYSLLVGQFTEIEITVLDKSGISQESCDL